MKMGEPVTRRSPVRGQLDAYADAWKLDHDSAMECRDCEEVIAVGLSVYRFLKERENHWRDEVFRGVHPFRADDERDFQSRLKNWLQTTEVAIRDRIVGLESVFGDIEGVSELRSLTNEAATTLTTWQSPKISSAIGLREINLTPEGAKELDRILQAAQSHPGARPLQEKMKSVSPEEFDQALRSISV